MASEVARVARRLEEAKETKFLDLSKCELIKIPDATYLMLKETVIAKCDFSGNTLKKIPSKFFTKFPALEELYLQDNQLSSLPDEIRDLEHLKMIDLTNNKFETFPNIICDCPKMKTVNLRENKVTELSIERLLRMGPLEELDLQDNPLPDQLQRDLEQIDRFTVHIGVSDPKGKELEEVE